ncbi:MAG: hypothetical protein MUF10_15345 [Thermoanaerobaculaceae bacterium]|jgi:hypothetical protein|nr:hypothetical protein [Thermoanaerobaculaceae bacterium]
MPINKSIVGDLINFRGMVYAPVNENGVIFLFGKVVQDLFMYVEEIKPGFPDCIARRFTGKGWERVGIEFEFVSSNFKSHQHNPANCDIIVCWQHDWPDCPLQVIELRTEILSLKNQPVTRPSTTRGEQDGEKALLELFERERASNEVRGWYGQIEAELRSWDEKIWTRVGKRYAGVYAPEKSFASLAPRVKSLQIECFSRDDPLSSTKVCNAKSSPRWSRFTVKAAADVATAVETLKESHRRLRAALKAGEPTAYFSGAADPLEQGDDEDSEGSVG